MAIKSDFFAYDTVVPPETSTLGTRSISGTKSIKEISKFSLFPVSVHLEWNAFIPGPLKEIACSFSIFPKILLKPPLKLCPTITVLLENLFLS